MSSPTHVTVSHARAIDRATRQDIFDAMRLDCAYWSGALDNVEFLGRIFDLRAMPSTDSRFQDAAGDIWQHTVNNDDLDRDWVLTDRRFDLHGCPDETFLAFLSETVHPVVRPDRTEAATLVQHYNEQLRRVGWEFVEVDGIAGRPRYQARRVDSSGGALSEVKRVADALDAAWMHREIQRAENAIEADPDLAIGCAKDLVETCCKTLLAKVGEEVPKGADFPDLVRRAVKALKLTRDDIPDSAKGAETVRTLLSNLTAVTKGMNELRNLYGTGHGRDGRHRGLEPRHARLAVSAAAAFVVFVADTYWVRTRP